MIIKIKPSKVFFIKLGEGGAWEKECIANQTLRLAFGGAQEHQACIAKQWDIVKDAYLSDGRVAGTASRFVSQIRDFYEADETVLWITFYKEKLWWAFSKPEVTLLEDGTKTRNVMGDWNDKDINGKVLSTDELSGKLLRTQGFHGTICNVETKDYVVSKINGEERPEVIRAKKCLAELKEAVGQLITHLDPKEFEILIDLIFSRCGWQRLGVVGKVEKTLDLDLISPLTDERAMVQIKSASNKAEFDSYCELFNGMDVYDKFFYVVHSPDKALKQVMRDSDDKIIIWFLEDIANQVIKAGLTNWLLKKAF